jgi:hypothetical protein
MTRHLVLAVCLALCHLLWWAENDPAHQAGPVEPRVTGEVMLHDMVWYDDPEVLVSPTKYDLGEGPYLVKHDWKVTWCSTLTFYSDGHYTPSKGE